MTTPANNLEQIKSAWNNFFRVNIAKQNTEILNKIVEVLKNNDSKQWIIYVKKDVQGKIQLCKQGDTGAIKIDLHDGLSVAEAKTLGIDITRGINKIAAHGWRLDKEKGIQQGPGAQVIDGNEVVKFDQAIREYASAKGWTFEEAQKAYYSREIQFGRQDLVLQAKNREAAYKTLVEKTKNCKKYDEFIKVIKSEFGIKSEQNPILLNLYNLHELKKIGFKDAEQRAKAAALVIKFASASQTSKQFQEEVLGLPAPIKTRYEGQMALPSIIAWAKAAQEYEQAKEEDSAATIPGDSIPPIEPQADNPPLSMVGKGAPRVPEGQGLKMQPLNRREYVRDLSQQSTNLRIDRQNDASPAAPNSAPKPDPSKPSSTPAAGSRPASPAAAPQLITTNSNAVQKIVECQAPIRQIEVLRKTSEQYHARLKRLKKQIQRAGKNTKKQRRLIQQYNQNVDRYRAINERWRELAAVLENSTKAVFTYIQEIYFNAFMAASPTREAAAKWNAFVRMLESAQVNYREINLFIRLSNPRLSKEDRNLLFNFYAKKDNKLEAAVRQRIITAWRESVDSYNGWHGRNYHISASVFLDIVSQQSGILRNERILGKIFKGKLTEVLTVVGPQEMRRLLGLSKEELFREIDIASKESSSYPIGSSSKILAMKRLGDLHAIAYARGFSLFDYNYQHFIKELPGLENQDYRLVSFFNEVAESHEKTDDAKYRQEFSKYLTSVFERYLKLPVNQYDKRILFLKLLSTLYAMALKIGISKEEFNKIYASAKDKIRPPVSGGQNINTLAELKTRIPISVGSNGLPQEVVAILRATGDYALVAKNLNEIIFTNNIHSGPLGIKPQGLALSAFGIVVIDAVNERGKIRSAWEIAAILVHEAAHVLWFKNVQGLLLSSTPDERNAFLATKNFLDKYLQNNKSIDRNTKQEILRYIALNKYAVMGANYALGYEQNNMQVNLYQQMPVMREGLPKPEDLDLENYPANLAMHFVDKNFDDIIKYLEINHAGKAFIQSLLKGEISLKVSYAQSGKEPIKVKIQVVGSDGIIRDINNEELSALQAIYKKLSPTQQPTPEYLAAWFNAYSKQNFRTKSKTIWGKAIVLKAIKRAKNYRNVPKNIQTKHRQFIRGLYSIFSSKKLSRAIDSGRINAIFDAVFGLLFGKVNMKDLQKFLKLNPNNFDVWAILMIYNLVKNEKNKRIQLALINMATGSMNQTLQKAGGRFELSIEFTKFEAYQLLTAVLLCQEAEKNMPPVPAPTPAPMPKVSSPAPAAPVMPARTAPPIPAEKTVPAAQAKALVDETWGNFNLFERVVGRLKTQEALDLASGGRVKMGDQNALDALVYGQRREIQALVRPILALTAQGKPVSEKMIQDLQAKKQQLNNSREKISDVLSNRFDQYSKLIVGLKELYVRVKTSNPELAVQLKQAHDEYVKQVKNPESIEAYNEKRKALENIIKKAKIIPVAAASSASPTVKKPAVAKAALKPVVSGSTLKITPSSSDVSPASTTGQESWHARLEKLAKANEEVRLDLEAYRNHERKINELDKRIQEIELRLKTLHDLKQDYKNKGRITPKSILGRIENNTIERGKLMQSYQTWFKSRERLKRSLDSVLSNQ